MLNHLQTMKRLRMHMRKWVCLFRKLKFAIFTKWHEIQKGADKQIFRPNIICVLPNRQIADRHFLEFLYLRILKSQIAECFFFSAQWRFGNVVSLHRKLIHRIDKCLNYTQRFIWRIVFKINIGWATDVRALSCAKQHNNNKNNNYCFSMWLIIADLFEYIKLKKNCHNLFTANWISFTILEDI